MKITLDSLADLAALRHAASKDKDRVLLSGVHLEPSTDGIVGRATNSYIMARRVVDAIPDHRYDGDVWAASVSGVDLAAAAVAFNARSGDDGSSSINVEFLVDAGGVPSGIDLELESSQPTLFDEDASLATYWCRVVAPDGFPSNVDEILDRTDYELPAAEVGLNPVLLTSLLKTGNDPKALIAVAVHGQHQPIVITHIDESTWSAAIMVLSRVDDPAGDST